MFATAEADARKHPKAVPNMPFRIDVDDGNSHARDVYAHWGFETCGWETSKTGRRYELMWRPPVEDDNSD
jgi:hypothetical protein